MFEFAESDEFFVRPSKQAIGNMGESIIVKDLIRRRFYVYVPVTLHGPCDMIILKGSQTLRVEVKTSPEEGPKYPQKKTRGRYDVLARVTLKNRRIRYKPTPESLILNFDTQIERCSWCGDEEARTTDMSRIPCSCPRSRAAMEAYYAKERSQWLKRVMHAESTSVATARPAIGTSAAFDAGAGAR